LEGRVDRDAGTQHRLVGHLGLEAMARAVDRKALLVEKIANAGG